MRIFVLAVVCLVATASASPTTRKLKRDILPGDPRYGTPYHVQHHQHHENNVAVPHAKYGVPSAPVVQDVKMPLRLPSTSYGTPFATKNVQPVAAPAAPQFVKQAAPAATYGAPPVNFKVNQPQPQPQHQIQQSYSVPTYQPAPQPAPAPAVPFRTYGAPSVQQPVHQSVVHQVSQVLQQVPKVQHQVSQVQHQVQHVQHFEHVAQPAPAVQHVQHVQHVQQPAPQVQHVAQPAVQHVQHVQHVAPQVQHVEHVQHVAPQVQHVEHVQHVAPQVQHVEHVQHVAPQVQHVEHVHHEVVHEQPKPTVQFTQVPKTQYVPPPQVQYTQPQAAPAVKYGAPEPVVHKQEPARYQAPVAENFVPQQTYGAPQVQQRVVQHVQQQVHHVQQQVQQQVHHVQQQVQHIQVPVQQEVHHEVHHPAPVQHVHHEIQVPVQEHVHHEVQVPVQEHVHHEVQVPVQQHIQRQVAAPVHQHVQQPLQVQVKESFPGQYYAAPAVGEHVTFDVPVPSVEVHSVHTIEYDTTESAPLFAPVNNVGYDTVSVEAKSVSHEITQPIAENGGYVY